MGYQNVGTNMTTPEDIADQSMTAILKQIVKEADENGDESAVQLARELLETLSE